MENDEPFCVCGHHHSYHRMDDISYIDLITEWCEMENCICPYFRDAKLHEKNIL